MDLVSGISNSISIVKRLNEVSKNIKEAEFKNLLADLSLELADYKLKLAEHMEEIANLKSMNLGLKKQVEGSQGISENVSVTFKKNAYYKEDDNSPFCSGCYDSSNKLSRLSEVKGHFTEFGSHKCPVCKQHYHL